MSPEQSNLGSRAIRPRTQIGSGYHTGSHCRLRSGAYRDEPSPVCRRQVRLYDRERLEHHDEGWQTR